MFNKIFLALFVIAILVMGVFTFLCWMQLQSIGFPPPQIVQNFGYYDNIYKTALWISSLVLLILANVIMWTYRKSWALWLTFAYFAVFILLNTWWLGDSLTAYQKQNGLINSSFSIGGIFGAVFVVVVGVGLFFNQFLVFRMRDKMFDKPTEQTQTVSENKVEEEVKTEENSTEEVKTEENSTEETNTEENSN